MTPMDETFVAEYEVARRMIARSIRCPDMRSIALVLVWWTWQRHPHLRLRAIVWYAIKHALVGRDLPGVRDPGSPSHDVWDKRACCGGAGMGNVRDRHPAPAQQVEDREAVEHLLGSLTPRQREMARMYMDGATNREVARRFRLKPGRASATRRRIKERWDELSE